MTFAAPLALVDLAVVPIALAAYVVFQRRRHRIARRYATAAMLPNVIDRAPGWRRHLPVAILLAALTALLVGAARPRAMITEKRENATIVLAVDSSRSMGAEDIRPSRLAYVKSEALRFLRALPAKYRVGLVAIGTTAQVAASATRDRTLVARALARLQPGGGTALGDGIAAAVAVGHAVPRDAGSRGRPGDVPPASVLLFTDGIQEGGELPTGVAVARARALKVAVSTVVVGTPYGFVTVPRVGGFTQYIQVPADQSELQTIAKVTRGHFYLGTRRPDFSSVFRDLGSRIGTTRRREEVSFAFAIAAASLLTAGGSLAALWLRRVP
jgi:Ca-activated chloride channel family protein